MKLPHLLLSLALLLVVIAPQSAAGYFPDEATPPPPARLTPSPTVPAGGQLGPNLEQFPTGVSPLTGLPVADPDMLKLPAILVSLSNFPPSVRPQTGLSFAPQVYEIYITEGMTRFLTVFYGDLPEAGAETDGSASGSGGSSPLGTYENPGDGLEGVRSGREAYVPIVNAFPNGCLVAASKSAAVNVNICRNVYGNDSQNINSAGITFDQMADLAKANQDPRQPVNYSGNAFNANPPAGGQPASQINVFYAWLNQAQWVYDEAASAYLRYEDFGTTDHVGEFRQAVDRVNGEPVAFENVVILFVEHVARRPTIIDLNMGIGTEGRAIVFRDGQVYTGLKWSMINEGYERTTGLARPIRLRNADGTPFELAPGQTWFHIATTTSTVWQVDSANAIWKYRFYPPAGAAQ